MANLLFPLLMFAAMWFLLIRPQQQRVRRQRELLDALELGDEVITAGGIIGTIVSIEGEEVRLSVSPGTELRMVRRAIAQVLADPDASAGELSPGEERS